MVLASQTPRTGLNRNMTGGRPRRRRSPLFLVVAVLLLVAGAAYWAWGRFGPSAVAAETQTAADGAVVEAAAPAPASAPTRHAAAPANVLTFDGRTRPTAATPREGQSTAAAPAPGRAAPASPGAAIAQPPAPVHGSGPLLEGMRLIDQGRLVEGRALLNRMLLAGGLPPRDAQTLRETLASVNEKLIFSPQIVPGDPLIDTYTIQSGDRLSRLAPQHRITDQAIALINGINPDRIRVGQTIKLVRGPFHAVVSKSDYRLDLFLNGPDGQPVYIRSFTVGLGQGDSTPTGSFVVRRGGKVKDPAWANPRNPGENYASGDPNNPIGKYWIGLEGADDASRQHTDYGIHGTIDPSSIGRQASMGCVRLGDGDIELLYKLLVETHSTVTIRP